VFKVLTAHHRKSASVTLKYFSRPSITDNNFAFFLI